MKNIVKIFMLLIIMMCCVGCREPIDGGANYQYLGKIWEVQYHFSCLDNGVTTTIRLQDDSFIVQGKVPFRIMRTSYAFVWINTAKNTIRIKQRNVIAEHIILEWKTLDWRKK